MEISFKPKHSLLRVCLEVMVSGPLCDGYTKEVRVKVDNIIRLGLIRIPRECRIFKFKAFYQEKIRVKFRKRG